MDDIQVNYAGQRAGKTHAVNGAVFVRGESETVPCSFERGGHTWQQFVVNVPSR